MSRIVLFDFDGTLIRGDSATDLMHTLLRGRPFRRLLAVLSLPLMFGFAHWRTASLAAGGRVVRGPGRAPRGGSGSRLSLRDPGRDLRRLQRAGGPWLGGWCTRFHCYGPRKLQALAGHGIEPPFACAYSDSPRDLPMLRAAAQVYLVEEAFHVLEGIDGYAGASDLAKGHGVVGIETHLGGQVEGDGKTGLPLV